MKQTILIVLITAVVVLLLGGNLFTSDADENREQYISQLVYSGLKSWHYSGMKVDDEFSGKAFWVFLEGLDPNKRFLLQSDIEDLNRYRYKIDDQFASGSTEVMKFAIERLKMRIKNVMAFYPEMLEKPFDFEKEENLELDADKRNYSTSEAELKSLWQKIVKYRTLLRYISLLEAEKKEAPNAELEAKARKAVAKSLKNIFDRLLQTATNDALSLYINSLIQVYDPHSNYFPPLDKDTFDLQMSGSFEGIGALLGQEDGYVKVSSIIPGGPSWKQKKLQPEDLILKVGQGDNEPEDIVGMRVTDAVKLIRGKKGTTVKLTVRHPDGQMEVIPIVRDVVVVEETFAKSAVVNDKKNGKRFGYIYLPKFYNDFNRRSGRNSTDDVKKELEKLKAKKVDGVILDLRFNSGGALTDAVNMSGLFLPEGPMVQVKDSIQGVKVLKDKDPKTIYDGPLVVMVNVLSASASEILAAALQDYDRAIIVGSNHSFGKGTVQAMINLDRFISKRSADGKSLGALTVTVQKFYRITGTSIQQRGVVPDIVLPDTFAGLEIGEKHLDYSLNGDAIPTAEFTRWTNKTPDMQQLASRSMERMKQDPRYDVLNKYIIRLKKNRNKTNQSLQMAKVMAHQAESKQARKAYEKAQEKSCHINASPTDVVVKGDTEDAEELYKARKEKQDNWIDAITKDFQLKEAMAVLTDAIESDKKS